MAFVVAVILALVVAAMAATFQRDMRRWVWLAYLEYLACTVAQLVYTRIIVKEGDTLAYAETGRMIARLLENHFDWAAPESLRMVLQQPSVFDDLVMGGGRNSTASMDAICGWVLLVVRGSDYAAHLCFSGAALAGAIGIYKAFRDAYPDCPSPPLFGATVLFPSIAFWTSALHKETICIAGLGAFLMGWRALRKRQVGRVLIFLPLGFTLMFIVRVHMMPPVFAGLAVFWMLTRLRRTRGVERAVFGPAYFGLALLGLALSTIAITRLAPWLGVDQIRDIVITKQQSWAFARGGSSFDAPDDAGPQTLARQILRLPLALLNALFRPQLFDVNNVAALLSAIEMTTITWLLVRAVRSLGLGGLVERTQRSPFLAMCFLVTFLGGAIVGLVTFNFGSLARYRVPILPFYGAFIVGVSYQVKAARAAQQPRRVKRMPLTVRKRGAVGRGVV
jgi:hypothetical protein